MAGAIASNIYGGKTYSRDFVGPIGPKDNYVGLKPGQSSYTAPKTAVLGASTSRAASTPTASAPIPTGSQPASEPDLSSMISDMYAPYLQETYDLENTVNANYAGDEKNLNDRYNLYTTQTNQNGEELTGNVNREEEKANKSLSSAYEQSIRDYNALRQQGRTRFGGGSSAGQAVGELAQREYFKNQGDLNEKRADLTEDFALERTRIGKYVKDKLDELTLNKEDALTQLKKGLQQSLADIRSRRYDIEANKTRDRLAAMQDAIAQARAIKQADEQFRQNLGLAAVSKMQEVSGRAFTPAEIQTTLSQFGINLNLGPGAAQQGSTGIKRPGSTQDEFASLYV